MGMKKTTHKNKITLEKLAQMTAHEFTVIHRRLDKTATKDDLKGFATKDDLLEMKETMLEEVKIETRKTLLSNDKVVNKLDLLLKESAAHNVAHKRIDDTLMDHEKRIKETERKTTDMRL